MSIHKKEVEAKRKSKVVTKVDALSVERVVKETNNLKLDVSKMLDILANKLEDCEKTKTYHITQSQGIEDQEIYKKI